jgi:hypothetical protein
MKYVSIPFFTHQLLLTSFNRLLKHINERGFGSKNNLFVHNITWPGNRVFKYEKHSYN